MNLRTGVQKTEDDTSMIWEDVGGKKSDVPFSLGSEITVNESHSYRQRTRNLQIDIERTQNSGNILRRVHAGLARLAVQSLRREVHFQQFVRQIR